MTHPHRFIPSCRRRFTKATLTVPDEAPMRRATPVTRGPARGTRRLPAHHCSVDDEQIGGPPSSSGFPGACRRLRWGARPAQPPVFSRPRRRRPACGQSYRPDLLQMSHCLLVPASMTRGPGEVAAEFAVSDTEQYIRAATLVHQVDDRFSSPCSTSVGHLRGSRFRP